MATKILATLTPKDVPPKWYIARCATADCHRAIAPYADRRTSPEDATRVGEFHVRTTGHTVTIEEVEGELAEIKRQEVEAALLVERRAVGMARTLGALIEIGRRKGYKSPETWAARIVEWREKKAREKVEAQAREYAR